MPEWATEDEIRAELATEKARALRDGNGDAARRAAELYEVLNERMAASVWWIYAAKLGDRDAVAYAREQIGIEVELGSPNACRWCGIDERSHRKQWLPEVGWHEWVPPTTGQRKARMLARREARLRSARPRPVNEPLGSTSV